MASLTQSPVQIHIDSSLQCLNIPLAQYLTENSQYDRLVVSAFIFNVPSGGASESGQQRRLLLLQRAAHERSYANLWEIPGGSSDSSDPTILHSLAREVFEETGLKLNKVLRQVGSIIEFTTGSGSRRKSWAKLSFEIEVAEIQGQGPHCTSTVDHDASKPNSTSQSHDHDVTNSLGSEERKVAVTIDPEEHQNYAWAALADLETDKYAIATAEQRDLMMEAFQRVVKPLS